MAGQDGIVVRGTHESTEVAGSVEALNQPEQPTDPKGTERDDEAPANDFRLIGVLVDKRHAATSVALNSDSGTTSIWPSIVWWAAPQYSLQMIP